MDKKNWIIILIAVFFSFQSQAQRIWDGEYTRLGLQAGANNFNILTGNFEVKPGTSWTAGFTTRANYYNDFQIIYGLNFFDFNASIPGREKIVEPVANEDVEFNMIGVQANIMGSYKIISNYLSVEAGPVIQVNGKFEPRQDKELFYVEEYDILASDLEDVSTFNFNMAVGLSGGFETLKFFAQYQYGINNFLNGLNDEGLDEVDPRATDFNGNLSIIPAGLIIFL